MKIHEYQAKALLARYGVPVPVGEVVTSADEAAKACSRMGGRAVVKVQVHAGGRGKAGGVKLVGSPDQTRQVAASLLGRRLVTAQTGATGVPVSRVLVQEDVNIARELYFSIATDGSTRRPVVIASAAGGVEIEEVARQSPEKILRADVDPVVGLQPFQGRRLAYALELPGALVRPFAELALGCYRLFTDKDCSLVEINPLVVTKEGGLVALDAKVNFDDDALFRHPDVVELRDPEQEDPLESQAAQYGISYVKLEGDVGCMVNGAGLAMATMDTINASGAGPANFLDVGGGADEEKVEQAFSLILSDPQVKRVLVNVFGGILRCDVAGRGIVAACRKARVSVPIVVRMLGTNVEEGKSILMEAGLDISLADTLPEAAAKIAAARRS